MAAGLQVDREYLNSKVGALGTQLANLFFQITRLQKGLAGWDTARLVTEKGFTSADADEIAAALIAMVKLKNLAEGTATQAAAVNHMAAIDKTTGVD